MTLTISKQTELGVRAIAAAVNKGEVSSKDLAEETLSRIATLEGRVQAWSHLDSPKLREDAKILSDEAACGRFHGTLQGVPVGIEDQFHVAGMPAGFRDSSAPFSEPADATLVTRLKAMGADVVDIVLPDLFGYAWPARRIIMASEGANINAKKLVPASRPATLVPAAYDIQAHRIRQILHAKVMGVFRDVEALLMPVAPAPAPKGHLTTGDSSLLGVWSLLEYPAITINGGLWPDGLPLGLQFVAAPR